MSRNRDNKLPPFVPLLKGTLDTPAWRATSHGARSLYVALKRRYNFNNHNNGRLHISQRDAVKEVGSSSDQITRWFQELQHFGFIVQTTAGYLGVDGKGKSPHWRLTEIGYMRDMPTQDFLRWDGTPFNKGSHSHFQKKQNPDAENRIAPIRKVGTVALRKTGALKGTSDAENRCIYEGSSDAENRYILSNHSHPSRRGLLRASSRSATKH
jgi:hypothetical protein